MVSVLRPGQRHINIPGIGVQTSRRAVSSAAWWLAGGAPTPVAVWQPKGAASLAASYLRIAGSGGNANIDPAVVGGVVPTFNAATGWGTNGTTQYLKTGVVPANGWSALIRISGQANIASIPFGSNSNTSTAYFFIQTNITASNVTGYINGSTATPAHAAPAATSGVFAIADKGYRDGVAEGTVLSGWSGTGEEIYIGARRNINVAANFFAGSILAFAVWDTQSNVSTWMPVVMAAVALI